MNTNYNGHSRKSGIYKIVNKLNTRFYIGSAKEFKRRYTQHLNSLKKGTHHNKFLQNDFNKCGTDAFVFEVLEVTQGTTLQRRVIEESYLDRLHDNCVVCYNVRKKTLRPRGQWSSSRKEVRAKISAGLKRAWENDLERKKARSELSKKMWSTEEYRTWKIQKATGRTNTPKQRQTMSQAALNRKPDTEDTCKIKAVAAQRRFENPEEREKMAKISRERPPPSKETRRKISESNKGKKCSAETRKKISKANKGKPASKYSIEKTIERNQKTYNVILIDPEGNEHFLETNLARFCRERNLNICGIHELVHEKNRCHKGWVLKKNYKEFKRTQEY